MEDLAFRPKTYPIFLNGSIKDAQKPSRRLRAVGSGWRWQKKSLKRTEDGSGSKARSKRERRFDLFCPLQSQEKRYEGAASRLGFSRGCVLSIPRWLRRLVANSAVFAALLQGGCGRGKVHACVGEKTRGSHPEVCRP